MLPLVAEEGNGAVHLSASDKVFQMIRGGMLPRWTGVFMGQCCYELNFHDLRRC